MLGPDGFAITFQNGIGNIEQLQAALGAERVIGGSSMCSAAAIGPGHVRLTHLGKTSIGETDRTARPRTTEHAQALNDAGFESEVAPDIMAVIWEKFALNCCINALAATTGLRAGEMARLPALDALQDRIIAEVMTVTDAKGIRLPTADLPAKIKAQSRKKFNRPSMLQHVEAGRRTEIDALNGALLREARALGIATPYNEALVALLKGRELHQMRAIHEPDLDYDAWEARIARGEED
jgi:2-dehydropantoate 2-reductase